MKTETLALSREAIRLLLEKCRWLYEKDLIAINNDYIAIVIKLYEKDYIAMKYKMKT